MKFIKKFERFISEEPAKKTTESIAEPVEMEVKSTISPPKTATALDVAKKFISLLNQRGDDVKKYIEKR